MGRRAERGRYIPGQMTYDLRRLRLNGLIRRLPHTHRYTLTDDGIRIAVFYTKVYNRLLVPVMPRTASLPTIMTANCCGVLIRRST